MHNKLEYKKYQVLLKSLKHFSCQLIHGRKIRDMQHIVWLVDNKL